MRHLVHMASLSAQTNMHARNLAIVWAPNLLRWVHVWGSWQSLAPGKLLEEGLWPCGCTGRGVSPSENRKFQDHIECDGAHPREPLL